MALVATLAPVGAAQDRAEKGEAKADSQRDETKPPAAGGEAAKPKAGDEEVLVFTNEDLKRLFGEVLKRDYSEEEYVAQFTTRVPECLAKLDRMEEVYATVSDTPRTMTDEMAAQRRRLDALRAAKGDYVSPFDL